jgi:spore maturation protein SpmA
VDIDSIENQLAKETPDTTTVARLWSGIDRVAKLAGMVDAVEKVWPLIKHLCGLR